MNIVLAVVVLAIVLAQGAEVPAYQDKSPLVGAVSTGSPAERAGIMRGRPAADRRRRRRATWDDLFIAIGTAARSRHCADATCVTAARSRHGPARRPGQVRDRRHRRAAGRQSRRASVVPGDPAEQAGVKAGDVIVAVNGERMVTRSQLIEVISRNGGKPIELPDRSVATPKSAIVATPEQRGERGMHRRLHRRGDQDVQARSARGHPASASSRTSSPAA